MDDPKLPCDVRIGGGTFRKGVAVSTLQGSIDRHVKRLNDQETQLDALRERIRKLEAGIEQESAYWHSEAVDAWRGGSESDYKRTEQRAARLRALLK